MSGLLHCLHSSQTGELCILQALLMSHGVSQMKQLLAACYVCRLSSVPGKFLRQKANELGINPGPLFGKLKNGIAVMVKDRMIQPDEARN